jgi:hypothetical protein
MTHFISHIEDFDGDLRAACFEFFFWFSRFEYALKANGLAKAGRYGEAQVNCQGFVNKHAAKYAPTDEARSLIKSPPKCQTYSNGDCGWEDIDLQRATTELGKVLLVVKTIRDNLFHGGKASQKDWDDPTRNLFLLQNGKAILDNLVIIADLESDYLRMPDGSGNNTICTRTT